MKIVKQDFLLEMANLNPNKMGLPVAIWSEHSGVLRNNKHKEPRLKIGNTNYSASVSIEAEPVILSHTHNIKNKELNNIKLGMEYVKRNYDLFLKHYMDTDYSFDDEDLIQELRARGEYK